jgi:hypothetical protein
MRLAFVIAATWFDLGGRNSGLPMDTQVVQHPG